MNRAIIGIRAFLLLFIVSSIVSSQNYPRTIWVPVTFYDFHSDRSNPEFEAPHDYNENKPRLKMVADTLDSDKKPVVGSNPYLNNYIHKWFRPFSKGDFTVPLYDPKANFKESYKDFNGDFKIEYRQAVTYVGKVTVDYDTAFKNMVFKDSLLFEHKGNGVYEFASDNFFPLDGKGFGNEWSVAADTTGISPHNFSYTMELHYKFIKKPGLTFEFQGDDDVWVFIDDKLQMDLGGIHERALGNFSSNDLTELEDGSIYSLDVFYAERHSAESHIRITTNFISPPATLLLYGKEGTPNTTDNPPLGSYDTITAGDKFPIFGHVFDSTGRWQPEKDSLIKWQVTAGEGTITNTTGTGTVFSSNKPNTKVTVTARYIDPLNSYNESIKTITFIIKEKPLPETAYYIELYNNPGDPVILKPLVNHDSLEAGQTYTIFGHIFDTSGVWYQNFDSLITWESSSNTAGILGYQKGAHTTLTGIIPGSMTIITAHFNPPDNPSKSISKSFTLYIKAGPPLPVYEIKLYKNPEMTEPIGALDSVQNGKSYKIFARVFDNNGIPHPELDSQITWQSSSLSAGTLSPLKGVSTIFTASQQDITVTVSAHVVDPINPTATYTKSVSLKIIPAPGPAQYIIRLYGEPGDPANLQPLGLSQTLTAGQEYIVYGHLFDTDGTWLQELDELLHWRLIDEKTSTIISPVQGKYTKIMGTIIGDDTLVVNFTDTIEKARPPSTATLIIHIKADAPYRLDIQPDSIVRIMTGDDPFEELVLNQNEPSAQIYAIERDKFGNFVGYANTASWSSNDYQIANISPMYGKTTTVIKGTSGIGDDTWIIASEPGLIPDTLKVSSIGSAMGAATPVPFIPGIHHIVQEIEKMAAQSNVDPNKVKSFYENVLSAAKTTSVTLIGIQSPRPLVPLNPNDNDTHRSYGEVKIYDAVGNVIKKDLKLIKAGSPRAYGITWDGTNSNMRIVGTGSYLVRISGVQTDGSLFLFNLKVGIKRK